MVKQQRTQLHQPNMSKRISVLTLNKQQQQLTIN